MDGHLSVCIHVMRFRRLFRTYERNEEGRALGLPSKSFRLLYARVHGAFGGGTYVGFLRDVRSPFPPGPEEKHQMLRHL